MGHKMIYREDECLPLYRPDSGWAFLALAPIEEMCFPRDRPITQS